MRERKDDGDDKLTAVSSKWDFLGKEIPDFLKSPIDIVIRFVEELPFLSEEKKNEFINRIKSMREDKFKS